MPDVYISIGSNVEREKNIAAALRALEERFGPLRLSSIYETAAVGFVGDPFYNLVAGFSTEESVDEVAAALTDIETRGGRGRGYTRFAPRTIDLDLILYGDLVRWHRKPYLPREELTRYAFMLEPLAEIAPDLKHPVSGETFAALWAAFDKSGLEQRRLKPDEVTGNLR
jgi:2-amino-4-hydroxy-6-hydroxymethyldihydropteridine diphosphokinase